LTLAEAKKIPVRTRQQLETAPAGLYRVRGHATRPPFLLARVKPIVGVPYGVRPGRQLEIPMGVHEAAVRADGRSLLILQHVF
jgi:hypothetical protein